MPTKIDASEHISWQRSCPPVLAEFEDAIVTSMGLANYKAAFPTRHRLSRDPGLMFRRTVMACLWLLFAVSGALGQQRPTDYQVKAAYLYNFGRFVEWPPSVAATKDGSFTVCVLGEDPFGSTLDSTLAGETIFGKNVVAKRMADLRALDKCQILFLSSAESARLRKIIEALDKEAVLTVSDMPQFSQHGGMIQFVMEGNRVRFEVNLAAAQHAGLTLSSELLKVASAVRKGPLGGD